MKGHKGVWDLIKSAEGEREIKLPSGCHGNWEMLMSRIENTWTDSSGKKKKKKKGEGRERSDVWQNVIKLNPQMRSAFQSTRKKATSSHFM